MKNNKDHAVQQTLKTAVIAASLFSISVAAGTVNAETTVRVQSENKDAAFSEGYSLSVEDWSTAIAAQYKNHTADQYWHNSKERPQIWISDIGTLLFNDFDYDGYHSGFSISIDVDSEFGDTEVYAKVYLESELEPLKLLHKTGRFSVYGTTVGDEYRLDTELRNNFPQGDYDLTVDIHDAWTDRLLDTASSRGFANLRQLPLESEDQNGHDSSVSDQYDQDGDNYSDDRPENQRPVSQGAHSDAVVTEHAGSFHPAWLALLFGGFWMRRRTQK